MRVVGNGEGLFFCFAPSIDGIGRYGGNLLFIYLDLLFGELFVSWDDGVSFIQLDLVGVSEGR